MIRHELVFRDGVVHGNQPVTFYAPTRPFEVDGIRYIPDQFRYCHRPMIEIFADEGGGGSPQWPSRPPTDDQLDYWVHTGYAPDGYRRRPR